MRRALKVFKFAAALLLLLVTWGLHVYHLGVYPRPELGPETPHSSRWIGKERFGINQLILRGGPYERGRDAGQLTAGLLYRQEKELTDQLKRVFPSALERLVLEIPLIRWFWGIERYLEPWMTLEMYGVSQSASHEFDDLADPFTRQVAYHGLHEVGQMMVDQGGEDMGCTVVAYPFEGSWVIGRNFDFEGGRVFDSEKIVKWVYPEQGYAFVSVIWAGMVGAVTGVNEHGVYISLNAAGSRGIARYGTPSTLVLLKALQFSANAKDALRIIEKASMFITDIFVVADPNSKILYRVEKSPTHTEVLPLTGPAVVTNHLVSPYWSQDSINLYRRDELTSGVRAARGEHLLEALKQRVHGGSREIELGVLSILRDKGEADGHRLALGNRRAIDPQIATHSVVYDAPKGVLYVSQGPAVAGQFVGFDLAASFKSGEPVVTARLPRDPLVSDGLFDELKADAHAVAQAQRQLVHGQCDEAGRLLKTVNAHAATKTYGLYAAMGDYRKCKGDVAEARVFWKKAQQLAPAYPREARALERKLGQEK